LAGKSVLWGIFRVWGWFERELQNEIEAQTDPRAVIFAGPFLKARDPKVTINGQDLRYPLRFWKVVVFRPDDGEGELRAMGFVFDQSEVIDEHGLGLEEIDRRLKRFQVRIQKISEEAKVQFDPKVIEADTMRARAEEKIALRTPRDVRDAPRRAAKP
jgi:DNA/RNA endonuclease G (NUC1)